MNSKLHHIKLDNENYYKIPDCDRLRPFFMSIVSDSNHWLFISSNGGLTAGRKNAEYALFPYYTDDKITESTEVTGSKSIFQVHTNEGKKLWEPFSERNVDKYNTQRNLYKNTFGNKVVFEEVNLDLGLTFRYQWSSSKAYGFVRKSTLVNDLDNSVKVSVLDGVQNIIPYGVGSDLQNTYSNLVDAYKRTELIKKSGLGIFALSAIIVDKAEPSEALKANVVWSLGVNNPKYLLSSTQLSNFRKGLNIIEETDIKAEKGAYLIQQELELAGNQEKEWLIVADVNLNHSAVAKISNLIVTNPNLEQDVKADIEQGTDKLIALAAASDGLQLTKDDPRNTRHFANTLFNIMRGGIFDNNYIIEKWDLKNYLDKANKKVARTSKSIVDDLPEKFPLSVLKELAITSKNKNFRRLCLEYMPLKFSRRHGDPSRPWNKFSINTRNEDGSKILDYEGNWRDIFQNWEALAHSYPEFIENMIHKFLNATTFDGYNPYRVTKDGFDWETIEPDDPWSYIGYWGDHQIIYLLKFLEFIEKYKPKKLETYFNEDLFVYANVPYKIKAYSDLLKKPKDTIDFDQELDNRIQLEKSEIGADGALLRDKDRFIVKVNFIEKILATTLAKLSNFIPEAGIWMNTQRPEWNDANNALVGNGVSMVTLYYLRRFLKFFENVFNKTKTEKVEISKELVIFFNQVLDTFKNNQHLLSKDINDAERKLVLDGLGQAGSQYRNTIYENSFSSKKDEVSVNTIKEFIQISLRYLEHSIQANKRQDNLYHAYNLMTLKNEKEISIAYLDEMLEGQVAVLSSGYLSSKESLDVLNALKSSALFRSDQYSYILYPNKELPLFTEKNNISETQVNSSSLLKALVKKGNTQIIEKDINNAYHFNGNFRNANDLKEALKNLTETEYATEALEEEDQILQIYETIFNHKAFTGRSGTFFGYEGLGSIYWHMVSKLQLAVYETCITALENNENDVVIKKLLEHYYDINEGIGVHKSPELYGAFPTDPYSHTPANKGAQQPGMTGQVKEDILSRFGELGVLVKEGKLTFYPCMLRQNEFLDQATAFNYVDVNSNKKQIKLQPNTIAFTYCQIPIVYELANESSIKIIFNDNHTEEFETLTIDASTSSKIFERTGEVAQIIARVKKSILK